jgi:hypothetical protein
VDARARVVATRITRRHPFGTGGIGRSPPELRSVIAKRRLAAALIDVSTVSITHPVPPSAPSVAAAGPLATATLQRAGIAIIASYAALLAVIHWLLFEQFLGRTVTGDGQAVAVAFRQYTLRVFGAEVAALAAAAAAVAVARLLLGRDGNSRRIAAAGTIAYAPIALWSIAVLIALALGWQPEVWLMSAANASDPEIAATIREALPIVLQPLLLSRYVATALGAVAFGILQWRLCRVSAVHAAIIASAAGGAALGAQLLMLRVVQ